MADDFRPTGQSVNNTPGLLSTIGHAIIDPALNYGKMVGGGLYESGRVLTDPRYRNIVQKTNWGDPLTDQEAASVLMSKNPFLNNQDLSQYSTLGKGLWQGAKNTAGMEAYLAPALIGPGAMGTVAANGALPAGQALALGAGKGIAQKALIGGARGLIGGALLGLSNTKENNFNKATTNIASGGLLGLGTGAAIGAASGALEKPIANLKANAAQLVQEKISKPVSDFAANTFARIFQMSKNKGTADLNPQMISRTWMENQLPIPKNLQDVQRISSSVMEPLGDAVDDAVKSYENERIPFGQVADAAKKEMVGKIGFPQEAQDEVINSFNVFGGTSQPVDVLSPSLQNLGLNPQQAQTATQILNAVPQMMGAENPATGMAIRDPQAMKQAAITALQSAGFDDATSQQIAQAGLSQAGNVVGPVNAMTPEQALAAERNIGANFGTYKAAYGRTGDPKMKVYRDAFGAAYRTLGKLIDNATKKMETNVDLLDQPMGDSGMTRIEALQQISPSLAEKAIASPTVSNWRSLMAFAVQAQRAAADTIKQQTAIFQGTAARAGAGMIGALSGGAISAFNPIAMTLGGALGGIIEPVISSASENVRVPLTAGMGQFAQSVSNGVIPAAIGNAGANALGAASNAITTAPGITGATQFMNWLGKDKSPVQPQIPGQDDFTPL